MAHSSKEEALPLVLDDAATIAAAAVRTADMLRSSKHAIVFTGAGISTACGIPDFRGPDGKWVRLAKGLKPVSGTPVSAAMPSFSHMAIKALVDKGILKAVISQNTDGLHARSGVPLSQLIELHGNSWKSVCWFCKFEVLWQRPVGSVRRTGCAKCAKHVPHFCHCIGKPCPKCGAESLRTSIINFGENLDEEVLRRGFSNASKADVCLALGSTLRVTPAADMPAEVGRKGKLVIVNLQETPLDELALVVHSKIDDFMRIVMSELGVDVPEWVPPELPMADPSGTPVPRLVRAVGASALGSAPPPDMSGLASKASTSAAARGAAPTCRGVSK